MATISSDKAASATAREQNPLSSQPQKPTRANTADEGRKWFGEKPPDRSRDLHISAWQPPHRHDPRLPSWKGSSGTIKTPTDDGPGRVRSEPSWGRAQALPEGPRPQGISSKPQTNHVTYLDLYPPPLVEEEEPMMHPSPLKDSTMEIEREEDEPDQWASPMAFSKMDESQGSTVDSLFYFTAVSELSGSSQESYWGLESTDGSTAEEFDYVCHPVTGEVAVVCKQAERDAINKIDEVVMESKRDPREVVEQLFETLNRLESDLIHAEDRSLRDSYEVYSCGSDESSWEQERVHPTLQYKYKPINLFFERKSTNTKTTPISKPTMTTTPPTVAANGLAKREVVSRSYLGVTRQTIARLLTLQRYLAITMSSWKLPLLTIQICNGVQKIQHIGKAIDKVALLRRCFFPRRDVIKW